MKELAQKEPDYKLYDDYQGEAYGGSHDPRLSKRFGSLINDLKSGKTVVVSDIRYCVPAEMGAFLGAILSVASNVSLNFKFFNNKPEQCKSQPLAKWLHGTMVW